jgi:2'-hydroxyisoflavone reductase
VQFIDVRDLAEWNLRMVETRASGTYNANGPDPQPTMRELLETCRAVANNDARFTWVSEDFLAGQGVQPWMEMPLWVPEVQEYSGFFAFDNTRAVQAGLTFRLLADTVGATMLWAASRPQDHAWRAGISPEREADLLQDWRRKKEGE